MLDPFQRGAAARIAAAVCALILPARALAVCGDLVVDPGEDCDVGFYENTCCQPDCTYRPEATLCDDRDECTTGDACDAAGNCIPAVEGCDDGDPCTFDWCGMAGCTSWPQARSDCTSGERSTLVVKDFNGISDKNSLRWRLTRGAELVQADLGDPVGTTTYKLCLFRHTTDIDKGLAAELLVGPGDAWTINDPKGATYEDEAGTADGVTAVQLRTGAAGKSRVFLSARGANLEPIDHYDFERLFEPDHGLRMQLHNLENGRCWDADYPTLRKNTATTARAKMGTGPN